MWNQKTIHLVENKNSFILGNMNNILLQKVLMGNKLEKYQALKYYLYFPREKKLNFKCHRMLIIFFIWCHMCQTEKFKEVKYFSPLHFYIFTSSHFNAKYYSFLFFFLPAGRKIEIFKDSHTEKKILLLKKKIKLEGKTSRINAGSFRFSWIE